MNEATNPFKTCQYTSYLSFGGSHCYSFACSTPSSQRMWLLNFALVDDSPPFHFGINAFDPTLDHPQAISKPIARCQQINSFFTNARFPSTTGPSLKRERTPSFLLSDLLLLQRNDRSPPSQHDAIRLILRRPRRRLWPCNRKPPRARTHRPTTHRPTTHQRTSRLRTLRHLLQHGFDLLDLRARTKRRLRIFLLRPRRPRHLLRRETAADPRQQLRRLFPRRATHLRRRQRHLLHVRPGRQNLHGSLCRGHRVCEWGDCRLQWPVRHQPSNDQRVECD